MTVKYYKEKLTFSPPAERSGGIEVDGRVVDVLSYDPVSGLVTVLVEREVEDVATTFESTPEPEPEPESSGFECGYPTANGECGRNVSDPDDYCWQHKE